MLIRYAYHVLGMNFNKYGMRDLINIVETALESVASPDDVARLVQRIHHNEDDLHEGDLLDRIYKFSSYILRSIPLSGINAHEWMVHDELVRSYGDAPSPAPPIVYDAVDRSIIDGSHRVNAALYRGDDEIMAYVGLPENLDPEYTPKNWEEE